MLESFSEYFWKIISQTLFVAPITLVGLTALSVEIKTTDSNLYLRQHSATFLVPNILFFIASSGLFSISGTCLCAAAWNSISGLYLSNSISNLSKSLTLAISVL